MLEGLRARDEWKFFSVLRRADRSLALGWWSVLLLRGLLPALFAITMGLLVGAVQRGDPLAAPLGGVGLVFVLLQVLSPLHQAIGANLGSRTGAWLATHWLLRESAVWRDRNTEEVREAQRHADYAYRLAVDPPAAKELRLFGLAAWTVERFSVRRRLLFDLRWKATRLRERPVLWSLLLVLGANVLVFASIAADAAGGNLELGRIVTFA